jgi:uncharacterized OB-fold protein
VTAGRPSPVPSPDDEVFWAHAARRELRLQRCSLCDRLRYPPAPCCPECLSRAADWIAVSGFGRLLTWARFHRTYFVGLPAPYVVAVVELDEGPLMTGNVDDESLPRRAGTRMRVVFRDAPLEGGGTIVLPQWEACKE